MNFPEISRSGWNIILKFATFQEQAIKITNGNKRIFSVKTARLRVFDSNKEQ